MITNALLVVTILVGSSGGDARIIRYIGNAGFEIADGRHTVLLDFPYESGAYGYMTFTDSELARRPGSLCLVSHAHADHFWAGAIETVGCVVAGPAQVMALVPDLSRMQGVSPWRFESVVAECVASEHADIEHCSFVLRWHGTTIVAAGDVESVEPLLEIIAAADIFVLPHWLANQATFVQDRFPGVTVILSHGVAGTKVDSCDGCVRPGQGDTLSW